MDTMSIAAASVGMNQGQAMQDFSVGMLKKSMDATTEGMEALLESLPQSIDPSVGNNVDVQA